MQIEDDRVAGLCRPPLGGLQLCHRRAQDVQLVVDEILGNLRLGIRHLHLRPVGDLGLREHGHGRGEVPVGVLGVGQLVVQLGLLDRADALPGCRVPEPAGDVALDRLAEETLLADVRPEHGHRNLALAEARNLDAGRQVRGRMLDGVMDVLTRDIHREPDFVVRELFDLRRHRAIRPNGPRAAAAG